MTLYSGVLWQSGAAEAKLSPADLARAAVAGYAARRGGRLPAAAVVRPGDGWPAAVVVGDGAGRAVVPIIPSPTVAFPSWILLVHSITEERDATQNG